MVDILHKKLTKIGTSNYSVVPATFTHPNSLKTGDEVEMLLSDHYILIKDGRDPFLRRMIPDELAVMYQLESIRKRAVAEIKEEIERDTKAMKTGNFQGIDTRSIDKRPPYFDALKADILRWLKAEEEYDKMMRDAKAKEHGDRIRAAKARQKAEEGKQHEQKHHGKNNKPTAK